MSDQKVQSKADRILEWVDAHSDQIEMARMFIGIASMSYTVGLIMTNLTTHQLIVRRKDLRRLAEVPNSYIYFPYKDRTLVMVDSQHLIG